MLVLDESVDRLIEDRLKNFNIKTARPTGGSTDSEVLNFAVRKEAPLITRDQGDFVILDADVDHFGIMIDKHMHLRDRTLVAETIAGILENYPQLLENSIVYLSNFYGQF